MFKKIKLYRLGELFCGPGGMAIASTQDVHIEGCDGCNYKLEHFWGVDFAKSSIETFKANLGDQCGICKDARKFVEEDLTEENKINALAFGFPCNSFSQVGERKGIHDTNYGDLYKTGIKVLSAYNPEWFIAENVSGIAGRDGGRQFRIILQELANAGIGYDVVAHLYKFEEYGVPQSRHRYVIVGIRHDIASEKGLKFKPPAPTHGIGLKPFVTVKEALSLVKNKTSWGGEKSRQSDKVIWRLKFTPPGENAWKLDELVDKKLYSDSKLIEYLKQLPWYEEDIKPIGSVEKIRAKIEECRLHCAKARMSHIYRRLDGDRPAYTLTGSGGGGTHVYHWCEHRALTNEERAALQTFPNDFVFRGTSEQIRKQIGMAVPTKAARQIFEAILKTMGRVHYNSVEPSTSLVFYPEKTRGGI